MIRKCLLREYVGDGDKPWMMVMTIFFSTKTFTAGCSFDDENFWWRQPLENENDKSPSYFWKGKGSQERNCCNEKYMKDTASAPAELAFYFTNVIALLGIFFSLSLSLLLIHFLFCSGKPT